MSDKKQVPLFFGLHLLIEAEKQGYLLNVAYIIVNTDHQSVLTIMYATDHQSGGSDDQSVLTINDQLIL